MRLDIQDNLDGLRTICVDPKDSISTLKAMVRDEFRFTDDEMNRRLLVHDGRDLFELVGGPSITLDECGVDDGTTLPLGLKGPFVIRVVLGYYESYNIEVSCYHTVLHLRSKIEEFSGKPVGPGNFPEVFVSSDEESTLLSLGLYRINTFSLEQHIIYLNRHNTPFVGPEFSVSTSYGFDEDEDDDLSSTALQIVVEVLNLRLRAPFWCEPTDTIRSVRWKMRHSSNQRLGPFNNHNYIMKDEFVLFFRGNRLDDSSATVDGCGIKHMDSVQLFEDVSFPIVIVEAEQEFHYRVEVACFDTIRVLKEKLRRATGVHEQEQRLVYGDWRLDDEERRLADYGIEKLDGSERVDLLRDACFDDHNHQISVEVPNIPCRFPLNVKSTYTINDVRDRIVEKSYLNAELSGRRCFENGIFVLAFGSKQLEDESVTLEEYGIGHMDSIQLLESEAFEIQILSLDHLEIKDFIVEMRCFDTVLMLKDKIRFFIEGRIRAGYLEDSFADAFAMDDDEMRLADYGIFKHTENDESPDSVGITRFWNVYGERPEIIVATSDTRLCIQW